MSTLELVLYHRDALLQNGYAVMPATSASMRMPITLIMILGPVSVPYGTVPFQYMFTMFRMFFILLIGLCLVPVQCQNMSRDALRGSKMKGMFFCCSPILQFFPKPILHSFYVKSVLWIGIMLMPIRS
jgi:hypothetical protein